MYIAIYFYILLQRDKNMTSLAQEDIEYIKSQFEYWLAELVPENKPGVYDLELRNRMLKVEQELKHQRELMQQGFELMEKRFEQVDKRFETMQQAMDKRFEQVDRRFEELTGRIDTFMRWSFGLTLTVGGIVITVLKFT